MNAKIHCPGCHAVSSLEGHASGTSFACLCGNKLPVPTGMRPRPFGWRWLPFLAGGIALQFAIVALVSHSVPVLPSVPGLDVEPWRSQTAAVRAELHDLCDRERAHFAKSHDWVLFAPIPATIPAAPVQHLDPRFAVLGFEPKDSAWQFFVLPSEDRIQCIARATLDESGIPWTIAVGNGANGSWDIASADEPPEPIDD